MGIDYILFDKHINFIVDCLENNTSVKTDVTFMELLQ